MTIPIAAGLDLVRAHAARNHSLAIAITTQPDTVDPQVALVNAGVLAHPVTGSSVLGFVARRGTKLRNLRLRPRATLVFQHDWEWVAVRGPAELAGPDDPHPDIEPSDVDALLRTIYEAAGGNHPDLDEYDRVMRIERRCAVLVTPERAWTNPRGSEHREPTAS